MLTVMAGIYAHVRGETVVRAPDEAETLNPLLERSSSPTHDRRKVALDRQRAIAIAEREMDRKRTNLQAMQEIDAAPLADRAKALARREEALRETGYGIATTTDDLEKREAATAQRETKLREQEDLHAELLQTAAQLREVTRAELNQAQLLRQTEAQLDERREAAHTFEELAVEREVGLRAAEQQASEHRQLRTEAEARARQAEAARSEAQQQLGQAEARRADAVAKASELEREVAAATIEADALRKATERATVLGDLKAEGAARLSEAATEAALQTRAEEVCRAEAG